MKHFLSVLTLAAFATLFMASGADKALVKDEKDDFKGISWQTMRNQYFSTGTNANYYITVQKKSEKGNTIMQLVLGYSGYAQNVDKLISPDYSNGEALTFIIDGAKVSYQCTDHDGPNERYTDFPPQEANNWIGHRDWSYNATFYYQITEDQLKQIAYATSIKLRATDEKKDLMAEGTLGNKNIADFKSYYEQYVAHIAPTTASAKSGSAK